MLNITQNLRSMEKLEEFEEKDRIQLRYSKNSMRITAFSSHRTKFMKINRSELNTRSVNADDYVTLNISLFKEDDKEFEDNRCIQIRHFSLSSCILGNDFIKSMRYKYLKNFILDKKYLDILLLHPSVWIYFYAFDRDPVNKLRFIKSGKIKIVESCNDNIFDLIEIDKYNDDGLFDYKFL